MPGMTGFDLLIRGGTLIDGTGSPGRPADVGIRDDRVEALGDLSMVPDATVGRVIEATGQVVSPGFIDTHAHSDATVLVDGALASHLHQGFTTQLIGLCGDSGGPVTPAGREMAELTFGRMGWPSIGRRSPSTSPASRPARSVSTFARWSDTGPFGRMFSVGRHGRPSRPS